jgi:tRNA (guanine-N7-)-methyltransferase
MLALVAPSRVLSPHVEAAGGHARHLAKREQRVDALREEVGAVFREAQAAREWVLELGCGHGHFLTGFAARHVDCQCLGVDFSRDRIGRAHRKRQRAGLSNLHFVHGEAGELLDALPDALRFGQIYVLFPDPWPKRRHRKNRLVGGDFLNRVANVSRPGAALYFRSDAFDYVGEVRAALKAHPRWLLLAEGEMPFDTETVFQARAPRFNSLAAVLVS